MRGCKDKNNGYCGTGIITTTNCNTVHDHDTPQTQAITVQCFDEPTRILKLCHGYNHLVLLKTKGCIQRVSIDDVFDESYKQLSQMKIEIKDVQFGEKHCLCLTDDGSVVAFGDNHDGQIGIGSLHVKFVTKPTRIDYFHRETRHKKYIILIDKIACGQYHSCAITTFGTIYTWGNGRYGQLGTNVVSIQVLPRCLTCFDHHNKNDTNNNSNSNKSKIKVVDCQLGDCFTAAITSNGKIYMCGDAINYQCGNGRKTQENECRIIDCFCQKANENNNENQDNINTHGLSNNGITPKKIVCGFGHTLCLMTNGDLYGWGMANYGALGPIDDNKNISRPMQKVLQTPKIISYFTNNNIKIADIIAVKQCSLIIDESNTIYFMGKSDMLFNGSIIYNPIKIDCFSNMNFIGYGLCNNTIAVICPTRIENCFPQVFANNGKTILKISGGNSFYQTKFEPKVKFSFASQEIIQSATWITNTNTNEHNDSNPKSDTTKETKSTSLSVTSPNMNDFKNKVEETNNYRFKFPFEVELSVSLDGSIFCSPMNIFAVTVANCEFNMLPQCGDCTLGDLTVVLSPKEFDYLYQFKRKQVKVENMKVILKNNDDDESNIHEYCIDAKFKNDFAMENICFKTPANMTNATYSVYFAIDGYDAIDTQAKYTAYDIKSVNDIQSRICLSNFQDTIPMEIEITQFAFKNRDFIQLRLHKLKPQL